MNKKLFLGSCFVLFALIFSLTLVQSVKADNTFIFNKDLKIGIVLQPDVLELQNRLNTLGYDSGIADGKFGPKTKAAVTLFQKAKNLGADGIVGSLTRKAFNGAISNFGTGCINASGFSVTTGLACSSVNANVFPVGCTNASGFSTTTGLACNSVNANVFGAGCTNASGFSVTTGFSCLTGLPRVYSMISSNHHHVSAITKNVTFALTTPAPDANNTIVVVQTAGAKHVEVDVANGTTSVVITATKLAGQTVTVSAAPGETEGGARDDSRNIEITGTLTNPIYTVNTVTNGQQEILDPDITGADVSETGGNKTVTFTVSEEGKTDIVYEVNIQVAEPIIMSNDATLDFTPVTGTSLTNVVLTDDTAGETGADEANARPLSVTIWDTNAAEAEFVPITDNATVTAYADAEAGGGTYVAVTESYDFSDTNTTLWIKSISEDTSETLYYKLTVTVSEHAAAVKLGTAGNFAILAKTAITTTGVTSISGNVGISPAFASDTTGFGLVLDASGAFATSVPSSLVSGYIYAADYDVDGTPDMLTTAVGDMEEAYTDANSRPTDVLNAGAGNLAGLDLVPGVYTFDGPGNVIITDDVILSGGPNDVWIFQIPGTLSISSAKSVLLDGASSANVFWAVAGTTTLGTTSTFEGNILGGPGASTIAMQDVSTLHGKALAQTAVTLIGSTVGIPR